MSTSSQGELWIEFVSGPRDGEILQCPSSPVLIGRGPDADLRLSWDSSISEQHARISRTGDGLTIEHLGEQPGTFVDGQEVTKEMSLEESSIICVGRTEFVCRGERTAQTKKKAESRQKTTDLQGGRAANQM